MSTRGHHGLLLGVGASDPYFSSVILLLDGTSTTDLSSYGHVASVGANVTIDSGANSNNGGQGTSSLRTNGASPCNWTYASAPEWRFDPVYTLEFAISFDTFPGNWCAFGTDDFNRFFQFVGASIALNLQGKFGSPASGTLGFSANTWHNLVEVSDGVNVGFFVDGVSLGNNGQGQSADVSDKGFDILDPLSSAPDWRMMNVRYTQGVARYNPLAPAIAVPLAPWPTS